MAKSEGDKQSKINRSEGLKTELINHSEGEKQRRINAAEGKAEEILAIAKATAGSIKKIANVISSPGGEVAFRMQLSEQYLKQLKGLSKTSCKVILPNNLLNYNQWMQMVGLDTRSDTRQQSNIQT